MNESTEIVKKEVRSEGASESEANPRPDARLDLATEGRLYKLYREYFQTAEETRNWNFWADVPWDAALAEPPAALTEIALGIYYDGVMLPDFSARTLQTLRASRGRAWFITRWSYEEVKCHLAVREWLICTGYADDELKALSDDLMASRRWLPPLDEPLPVMADALLAELQQIEKTRHLHQQAKAAGDAALTDVAARTLLDHEMHRDFFRAALMIIAENYAGDVRAAIRQTSLSLEDAAVERTLLALLDMPAP